MPTFTCFPSNAQKTSCTPAFWPTLTLAVLLSALSGQAWGQTTTLSTQAQVDAFFTVNLVGNLVIDGNGTAGTGGDTPGIDPITDLSGLSELMSISGNLTIRDFNVGIIPNTLSGLDNLSTVGGSVTIGSAADNNTSFTSIILAGLTSVGTSFTITNNFNASLTTISLPVLTSIGTTTSHNLTINTNGTSVTTISLLALSSVGGNLTMSNIAANATAADVFLISLTTIGGSANFTRTAKSLLASSFTSLGASGALTFSTNALSPAGSLSLPSLSNVPGAINVNDNTGLTGINIPTAFTNPTASVSIDGNAGLESVVLGVKSTTTDLIIQSNGTALTTLTLSNLMTVGRHLDMNNAAANNVNITAAVNLSALVSTGGRLRLVRAIKTLSIDSLTDVGTDGLLTAGNRTFTFQRNGITDLDATFPSLLNIGGNLSVTNNTSLSQCCIIPCLLSVTGTTTVSGNAGNCLTLAIADAACSTNPPPLNLELSASDITVDCGEETLVDVLVQEGFNSLTSLTYFIGWDTAKFEFVGVVSLPVLNDEPAVTIDSTASGYLGYSWPEDFGFFEATTLSPGTSIMQVRLRAKSCTSGSTTVFFANDTEHNPPYYAPIVGNLCFTTPFPVIVTDLTLEVPDVTISCPDNTVEVVCQSQGAINDKFTAWLADVEHGGGCDPVLTPPTMPAAPLACGGTTTLTWSVTSDCGTTMTCSATFTVTDAPPVMLTCPDISISTEEVCQTQEDIDNAFDAWLETVSNSGGCNAVRTRDPETPEAPSACGGSTTVTWTVTSDCEEPVTCSATFTVTTAPDVTLNCPDDVTENACQPQEDIDILFADWLLSFGFDGGCGGEPSFEEITPTLTMGQTNARSTDGPRAPSACGGSNTVRYTVSSDCASDATCDRTFTVTAAPPVTLICPDNTIEAACQTQMAIDMKFTDWLATVSYGSGCHPSISNDNTGAPKACGGSTTVTWTVTSDCEKPATCSATFSVEACIITATLTPPGTQCDSMAFNLGYTVSGGTGPYTIRINGMDHPGVGTSGNISTTGYVPLSTYTLELVTDANGCTATGNTLTVDVNDLPALSPVLSSDLADNSTTCPAVMAINFLASLTPAAPASGIYGFTWGAYGNATATGSPVAGFSPNGTSNPVTRAFNSGNGNKSVRVTVTTPGCPSVTGFINWTQVADPTAGTTVIEVAPPGNSCPGTARILTVSHPSPYLTIAGVTWSGAGSGTANPYPVMPTDTSTYNVLVSFANWGCGNVNDAITVDAGDAVPPTPVCQNVTVQLDNTGNGSTTAAAVDNGSSDNCGVASLILSQTAFTCIDVGSVIVTLTVTDVNSNTATCTATVTVEDNVDPMPVCQDVTVELDSDGNGSTTATAVDNGSSDACGIDDLSLDITAFDCDDVGSVIVTLTVTDENGNTATCTATVTVEDNVDPVA
ncbi:MAG: hypothetical protein ACKVU2_10870, partial [Saprospiraceae bacterium]